MSFTIEPVKFDDYQAISDMFPVNFEQDRNSRVKRLGDISYFREDEFTKAAAKKDFIKSLQRPDLPRVKAVNANGELLGSIGIAYLDFEPSDIPPLDISILGPLPAEEKPVGEPPTPETPSPEKQRANEMVQKMEDMQNQNWKDMAPVLRVGRTIVVAGLGVRPDSQRMGIGSALLKWANEQADAAGVPIWVHSSEAAYRAYEKAGFEIVDTLDIDLDAWAPSPPPEGGVWGHYLIRWMRRYPKSKEESTVAAQ